MSGTLPIRESALAQVAARLIAQIPTAAVDRARRAMPDTDREAMPRLVVMGLDLSVGDEFDATRTRYEIGFAVRGYVAAGSDLGLEQAMSLLHARVVQALANWTPGDAALGDVRELGAAFTTYDAADSARPAGEFESRFTIPAYAITGFPFSA
jgi:hypothetical protein